jgi:hypothetical protein
MNFYECRIQQGFSILADLLSGVSGQCSQIWFLIYWYFLLLCIPHFLPGVFSLIPPCICPSALWPCTWFLLFHVRSVLELAYCCHFITKCCHSFYVCIHFHKHLENLDFSLSKNLFPSCIILLLFTDKHFILFNDLFKLCDLFLVRCIC